MIYHVETNKDFLFFEADNKKQIIDYCNKNKMKINAITLFNQQSYEDLLFVGFVNQAIKVN